MRNLVRISFGRCWRRIKLILMVNMGDIFEFGFGSIPGRTVWVLRVILGSGRVTWSIDHRDYVLIRIESLYVRSDFFQRYRGIDNEP